MHTSNLIRQDPLINVTSTICFALPFIRLCSIFLTSASYGEQKSSSLYLAVSLLSHPTVPGAQFLDQRPNHNARLVVIAPSMSKRDGCADTSCSVRNVPDNTQVYVVSPDLLASFPSSIPFILVFVIRVLFPPTLCPVLHL